VNGSPAATQGAMKPEMSLYLDAVRFVAALTVFVAHFVLHRLSGGFLWQLNAYGHQAVAVFFVLSGFVIAYATDTRERDARSYTISRLSRMYSVVLPAVLLTVVLDLIGGTWRPDVYSTEWGFANDWTFARLFAALTFTNEIWGLHVKLGSNAAYWSMGYEVPYYVIFGLALFTPPRWRTAAVVAAVVAAGPAIIVSMPLWLGGVAAYHYCKRDALSARSGLWLYFGSAAAWMVYELLAWRYGRPMVQGGVYFRRLEVLQDAIVGPLFVAHLIGFNAAARPLGPWLLRHARAIRWTAGASFTLYLCHMPIAQFLLACAPWPSTDPRTRLMVFTGTMLAVFVFAEFTERRKTAWRRGFEVLHARLSARSPPLPGSQAPPT
jgi:peptidoglycan/LPS O-acetylase OafA/YrhL